jgi:hypothetical protein
MMSATLVKIRMLIQHAKLRLRAIALHITAASL